MIGTGKARIARIVGLTFSRNDLVGHLEQSNIATRLVFGGNLTQQPAYEEVDYRVVGSLENTDAIMHQAFWVGVYPGLSEAMIEYMVDTFASFIRQPARA